MCTIGVTVTEAEKPLEFEYEDVNFTVLGAEKSEVDGELLLTFTKSGSMTIDGDLKNVKYLVVGGGGSGEAGRNSSSSDYQGNGGGGAKAIYKPSETLSANTYQIVVGEGGPSSIAYTSYSEGNFKPGTAGSPSSFAGVTAAGGTAGTGGAKDGSSPGTGGSELVCNITGSDVTYGKNGKAASDGIDKRTKGEPGVDGTGEGGQGGRGNDSGKGGNGVVILRIPAQLSVPVVDTLSVTAVKRGDTLSTSTITLTMKDAETGDPVVGTEVWKEPSTVLTASGEYAIVFTPTSPAYGTATVMAQVSVIAPQEDDAEEVIDNGTSVTVTTTSFGSDWSATVVSGTPYIETPELTVNDDDTATVTIKGKAIGTAVVDLYDGETWVKRITVAVMAPPSEGTVELTMDIDDAAKTVQTTTTASYWGNTIVSGADFVTATTAKNSGTGARIATTTITPKAYGTAVIEVRSGTSQYQLNTLVQRIIVTVAPPIEGSQTITVAQNASKVVKTVNEIDSYEKADDAGSISSVTVGDCEATIVASDKLGTAKVKLYNGDTLVKVVTVNVVDPTHTILTLYYAEVMEFTLTNATSASWSATATGNVRLMTAATTTATSQNGSGTSFTIKICGDTANGSGTVTVKQGQNTVMTYDCTVLADIAEDTSGGYNSIQSGKKSLSVYIGEPLNLSYYRQSAAKWRFVDAEITSEMFADRSKYTYKELGVFKATTSKGYTYSKGESGTASGSANLTSATSSDFDATLEGVKIGKGSLAVCFGSTQPSHYAGYYDVTVWKPIAKPAATKSFTYNGMSKAPVEPGEGYTVSGDAIQTAAGTYAAIVTLDEYYCWPDHSTDPLVVEWTIEPAEITTATATNQTYTGSALTPELTVQAGDLDATYDLDAWDPAGLTAVGTYTATVTGKGNFKGEKPVTFTIDPVAITVTACDTNMLVGCTAPQFKYEVTSGELVGTDELVGTLCTTDTLTVGTHDIVRANDWNNPNYDITFVKGTLTVRAGKVTVNGKGYDDVAAAMADVTSNGGTAVFNGDETFKVFTFEKDTTLTVADDTWFVTNNLTLAATTVTNDISVSEKLTLAGNVTVGSDDHEATLAFGSIDVGEYKLTLTTNGVVQSATQLDDAVFAEVEHFEVVENEVEGVYVYTLEATEFYVKYYDGDEVVHSNKFTILNYMTDLHVWDGTRDGLVLVGYTREDKTTKLDATDAALRAYVADEAAAAGCDGEVKVFGTWEPEVIPVEVPTAVAGLTYDGNEQTGVVATAGFTLTGNVATNAGSYTAEAKLDDGYCWADDSITNKFIAWSIAAAKLTEASAASQTWTGSKLTPVVTAKAGELGATTADFDVGTWSPDGLTDVGTYTAKVTGKGNFTGEVDVNFEITAATTFTVTIEAAKDHSKVTVTSNTTEVAGFTGGSFTAGVDDTVVATYTITDAGWQFVSGAETVFTMTEHGEAATAPATEAKDYEITFVTAQGTAPAAMIYAVTNDFPIALPSIDDAEGYLFVGWTNDTYQTAIAELAKPDTPDDITLVAKLLKKIDVPTAVSGLIYNGNEQTGVVAEVDADYTLTDNTATNAGSYTAVATLKDVLATCWEDGTTDPTNISWSIAKLAITVTPDADQSKAKGVDYTITFTPDPDLAEGDAFTGALAIDNEQVGDCEIVQGTLAIDDDNGGANYDLTVASGVMIKVTDSQNVEPGQTTEVTPEKEPTTPEEVAAAEAAALNKVVTVITDDEAKEAGQGDVVKKVAKYNPETKKVDVTLAIDTNSENYVEMDAAITDISTNLEDVVSGESSALKIPADEVTPGLYYNVIVEDENGNVTTGECALATSEGGVNLPVPEIDPNVTGLYFTVEQHLLSDGSDEGVVSKTLGYLGKDPTETEATIRDFVGAPWGGMTDSEEIAVENFVKTENLKEGTKLYSYDEGKDAYNAWELDENKSWKPIKTYMMADGKLTEQETKTADTAKIKRGTGAWVEHVKLDKKFVFVGDATRSEVAVPTTEGYNALSAKNFESLDLNDTLLEGASSKDSIIIPQAGSVPLVCTLKDGKWGYDSFTETEKKIGGQVQKVRTNTRVTNIKIPAGSAFWYVRGKTAK